MITRLTRRELAVALTAPVAVAQQKPPLEEAEQSVKRNLAHDLETLRNFAVPMSTEPAFRFEV